MGMVEAAFANWRKKGYPFYALTDEQKLNQLEDLRRYGAAPVVDGTVQQSMRTLGLAWSYHPHHINVRCAGMKTVAEGWADDAILRSVISKRMEYSSVLTITASEMTKGIKSATGAVRVELQTDSRECHLRNVLPKRRNGLRPIVRLQWQIARRVGMQRRLHATSAATRAP